MSNIKEDHEKTSSHRVISTHALLNTHSDAIKALLKQISDSYHISIDDAAFAVAAAMERIGEMR